MQKFKASQLLAIIEILAKVALEKGGIEYNEVSKELAESYNVKISPDDLEYPFDIIDRQAYKLGLSIISSVVISKRRNRPGVGYFKFLGEIKNNNSKCEDEESIWIKELKEVKACKDWSLLFEYYQSLKEVEEKSLDKIRKTNNKEGKNENSDSNP